jgi:hypothetical protein
MADTNDGPAADCIENRTFDEIHVGESAQLTRRLTMEDIRLFAAMSVLPRTAWSLPSTAKRPPSARLPWCARARRRS